MGAFWWQMPSKSHALQLICSNGHYNFDECVEVAFDECNHRFRWMWISRNGYMTEYSMSQFRLIKMLILLNKRSKRGSLPYSLSFSFALILSFSLILALSLCLSLSFFLLIRNWLRFSFSILIFNQLSLNRALQLV